MDPEITWEFLEELNDVFKKFNHNIFYNTHVPHNYLEKYEACINFFNQSIDFGRKLHTANNKELENELLMQTSNLIYKVVINENGILCDCYKEAIESQLDTLEAKPLVREIKSLFNSIRSDLIGIGLKNIMNDDETSVNTNTLKNAFSQFSDNISKLANYLTSINCYRLGAESANKNETTSETQQ